jgi:hypothetical protein
VCERPDWHPKWKQRYDSAAAKRAEREDDYLLKPCSCTIFHLFKPLEERVFPETAHVVDEKVYVGQSIENIPIVTKRDRIPIACRVGGVTFYPVVGKLSIFAEAVYFRYNTLGSENDRPGSPLANVFLAIPLDRRHRLITGEIFTGDTPTGIGWIRFVGDRRIVISELADAIHPSVTTAEIREYKPPPLPMQPDLPDSTFALLQHKRKTSLEANRTVDLPPESYQGKNINAIQFPTGTVRVGKLTFYRASVPGRPRGVMTLYHRPMEDDDEVPITGYSFWVVIPVGADNLLLTGELFSSENAGGYLPTRYPGDPIPILRWICEQIDSTVVFTELRVHNLVPKPPIPDPSDSYAAVLRSKCQHRLCCTDTGAMQGQTIGKHSIEVARWRSTYLANWSPHYLSGLTQSLCRCPWP